MILVFRKWMVGLFFGSMLTNLIGAELPSKIPLWPSGAPGSEARKDEPEKSEGSNVSGMREILWGSGLLIMGLLHLSCVTVFVGKLIRSTR